ncbi:Kinesin-like protein KIF21B [Smittium culicis]|uniref:Kinesin-like protein KIF21B n=1 Tax=Smittium culicis TaxID=133412 RepID=A0A1R1XPU4_9FUNG|nr:Kinesin-like protein KIF21B [Smittium culicis]
MGLVAHASDSYYHDSNLDKNNDSLSSKTTPVHKSFSLETNFNNQPISMKVKVAVRVRPTITRDNIATVKQNKKNEDTLVISPKDSEIRILGAHGSVGGVPRVFKYDYVFDIDSTQQQIYVDSVHPLVEKFYEGFNVTVFAYGQTGSGKSYTMGTKGEPNQMGIVGFSLQEIFNRKNSSHLNSNIKREFRASYIEIYNEDLIDLIAETHTSYGRPPVQIREDSNGRIIWSGAVEQKINSAEEAMDLLLYGSMVRQTGETKMNNQSSRSHAIFMIVQTQTEVRHGVEMQSVSKFNFVDLAGSERLKKTKAVGGRAKEGISINSGLLALGNVISALAEVSEKNQSSVNHNFVPYRNSKLTRLLQDSLGGTAFTIMIACVSMSKMDVLETLNTLKYASRAGSIKNTGSNNWESLDSSLLLQIAELKGQVSQLKDLLKAKELENDKRENNNQPKLNNDLQIAKLSEMENLVKHLQNNLKSTNIAYSDLKNKYTELNTKFDEQSLHQDSPGIKFTKHLGNNPDNNKFISDFDSDRYDNSADSSNILYSKRTSHIGYEISSNAGNRYNDSSLSKNISDNSIAIDQKELEPFSTISSERRLYLSSKLNNIKKSIVIKPKKPHTLGHKPNRKNPNFDHNSDVSEEDSYISSENNSDYEDFESSDLNGLITDYQGIIDSLESELFDIRKQSLLKDSQLSIQNTKLNFADQLSRSQSAQLSALRTQFNQIKEISQNEQDRRMYVETLLESFSNKDNNLSPSDKLKSTGSSIDNNSTEMNLVMEIERLKHEHNIQIQNLNARHEQDIYDLETEHEENLLSLEQNFHEENEVLKSKISSLTNFVNNHTPDNQNKELLKKLSDSTKLNENISNYKSNDINGHDMFDTISQDPDCLGCESAKEKLEKISRQRDDLISIIENSEKEKINAQNDRNHLQLLLNYAQNEVIERTGAFKQLQIVAYNAQISRVGPIPFSQRTNKFSIDDMALNDYDNYKNKVEKISQMLPEEKRHMLTRESFGISNSYQNALHNQDLQSFRNSSSNNNNFAAFTNFKDHLLPNSSLSKNLNRNNLKVPNFRKTSTKSLSYRDSSDRDYMINSVVSPLGIFDDGIPYEIRSSETKSIPRVDVESSNNRISLHAWLDSEAPLNSPLGTVGFSCQGNSDYNIRYSHDSYTMVGSNSYISSLNSLGLNGSTSSLHSVLSEQSRMLREKVAFVRIDALDPGPYPTSLSKLDYSSLDNEAIKKIHLELYNKIETLNQHKSTLMSINELLLRTFESFEAQSAILSTPQKVSISSTKQKTPESVSDAYNTSNIYDKNKKLVTPTKNFSDNIGKHDMLNDAKAGIFNHNTNNFNDPDAKIINSTSRKNSYNSSDIAFIGKLESGTDASTIQNGVSNINTAISVDKYNELLNEKANLELKISNLQGIISDQEAKLKRHEHLGSNLSSSLNENEYSGSSNDGGFGTDIYSNLTSKGHFDSSRSIDKSKDTSQLDHESHWQISNKPENSQSISNNKSNSNLISTRNSNGNPLNEKLAGGKLNSFEKESISMHMTKISIEGMDMGSELVHGQGISKGVFPSGGAVSSSNVSDLYINMYNSSGDLNREHSNFDLGINLNNTENNNATKNLNNTANNDSTELNISEFKSMNYLEGSNNLSEGDKKISKSSNQFGKNSSTLDGLTDEIQEGNYSFGEDEVLSNKIQESLKLTISLKKELDLVSENLIRCEENLQNKKERIGELEEELSAHKALINALEESLGIFESQISEITEDKNRYSNELMRAKSETKMLNDKVSRLSFQLAEAIKNAEVEAKDRDIWKSRFKDLQAENEAISKQKKKSTFLCF